MHCVPSWVSAGTHCAFGLDDLRARSREEKLDELFI